MEFNSLQSIINKWNLIQLFPYCPQDEYSIEIKKIKLRLEQCREIDETKLGNIIYDVFVECFGSTFKKGIEECINIAKQIINKWQVVALFSRLFHYIMKGIFLKYFDSISIKIFR